MADNFNLKNFLFENKLGSYSKLKEEVEEAKSSVSKEQKIQVIKEWIWFTCDEGLAKDDINKYNKMVDMYFADKNDVTKEDFQKIWNKVTEKYGVGDVGADYEAFPETWRDVQRGNLVNPDKQYEAKEKEEETKEDLKEYEVIYRIEDGRCYRITDEGYKDEVNMSYCRRFAEGVEKKGGKVLQITPEKMKKGDFFLQSPKNGFTEFEEEIEIIAVDPEKDTITVKGGEKWKLSGTSLYHVRRPKSIKEDSMEEDLDEVDVRSFDYSGGLPTKKYRPYAVTMEDIVDFVKKYPGITMKELALKAYGNYSGGKSNYDGKEKILQGAIYMIDRAVRAGKIVKVKDIKVGKAVFTYFTPEDYQEFLQKKKSMNIGKITMKEDSMEENYFTQEYVDRMEGLANIQDLAVFKTKLTILASDWMQEGFEKEDVLEYVKHLLDNQFNETKEPTNEAMGGKNPEGDKLVKRFLQGVAKKFEYSVEDAAKFVKDTIKSLGY